MKKKKHAFLLLEVLIALTLLTFFGLQWMKPSYQISAAKKRHLELMQLNRYGKEAALLFKMDLLAGKIALPKEHDHLKGTLPPRICLLTPTYTASYLCDYDIHCTSRNPGKGNKQGHIYQLDLNFTLNGHNRGSFTYPLYIEEMPL